MKKKLLSLLLFLFALGINAQVINIPDTNFKNKLLQSGISSYAIARDAADNAIVVDINNDGEIQQSEADNIYMLRIQASNNIMSLEGITSFTNLQYIGVHGNPVTAIDFSGLANLNEIRLTQNYYLSSLNFTGLDNIEKIFLHDSDVTNLDLSMCTTLKSLGVYVSPLGTIDLSALTSLQDLTLGYNGLLSIDLSALSTLTSLAIYENSLTFLDVSNNLQLTELVCFDNAITSINVANNNILEEIVLTNNQVSSFDFSLCPNLKYIGCENNLLTSVDLSNLAFLEGFRGNNNPIDEFDFSNNPLLTFVDVSYTDITTLDLRYQQIIELSLTGCANLETLLIHNNSYEFYGESEYHMGGLESLNSICCDEEEEDDVINIFSNLGYSDVVYSTDCEVGTASSAGLVLNELTVYPNPANNIVQLKSADLISSVCLYDMQGRMLINKPVNDFSGTIALSQYPAGMYFLEVSSGKNKSTKKIIKN